MFTAVLGCHLPSLPLPLLLLLAIRRALQCEMQLRYIAYAANTIFYTGEHAVWGGNRSAYFQQGDSISLFSFLCIHREHRLIRCTYAKKISTSHLFTINISISMWLWKSAEKSVHLFQHLSNHEMIHIKLVLTLQMFYFEYYLSIGLARYMQSFQMAAEKCSSFNVINIYSNQIFCSPIIIQHLQIILVRQCYEIRTKKKSFAYLCFE